MDQHFIHLRCVWLEVSQEVSASRWLLAAVVVWESARSERREPDVWNGQGVGGVSGVGADVGRVGRARREVACREPKPRRRLGRGTRNSVERRGNRTGAGGVDRPM